MAKPVTLKVGQYLLLVVALMAVGAAGGVMATAIHWHLRGAMLLAIPIEIAGMAAFGVLAVWKTLEARAPGKPLYF